MKRELKHDILAEKIWERLPEQDKQLRRVRRSITQRAADHAAGTGSLAGEPELLNWQALSGKLKLEPQEEDFIEKSWEEVLAQKEEEQRRVAELEEQARREKRLRERAQGRTRVAWIVSIVALVAAGFAIWLYGEAEEQSRIAKKEENRANTALLEAEASRDSTKEALILADSFLIAAEASRDSTQEALKLADGLTKLAREEEARAEQALSSLQAATAQLLDSTLSDAQRDILALDYEAALAKYQNAAQLDIQPRKVGAALMEIAFFGAEAGQYERAWPLVEQVVGLYGSSYKNPGSSEGKELESFRRIFKNLDPNRYQELQKRYYPEMVEVPGGTFQMGCDSTKLKEIFGADENCPGDELPQHEVTLKPFRIARTETTVWQYYLYTLSTNRSMPKTPSWQWKGKDPVVRVSWYDAIAYANWLSERFGKAPVYQLAIPSEPNDLYDLDRKDSINWQEEVKWTANGFRLPTEAEWEYAARVGTKSKGYIFAGSDSADLVAWYAENNDPYGAKPVQEKLPNELGLYDMSGNVWEWCWDWYSEDFYSEPEAGDNPRGAKSGGSRVLRGGSWYDISNYLRSSSRYYYNPRVRGYFYGFRLSQGY